MSFHVQQSFRGENQGILFLVATPIGNLQDMSYRSVETLNEVDLILAEDTRRTKPLLHYYQIKTPVESYHQHNERKVSPKYVEFLKSGKKIALVSDAGMPLISDPGSHIVELAIQEQVAVTCVPGSNAALFSLAVSGLPSAPFIFIGFLPRNKKELGKALEKWKRHESTLIFYEAPHRVQKTLEAILAYFGNRRIVVARELTKKYEEIIRGDVQDCVEWFRERTPQGEFCIVVEGCHNLSKENGDDLNWWEGLTIIDHITHYEKTFDHKEAYKKVAIDRGVSKREIYQTLLEHKKNLR